MPERSEPCICWDGNAWPAPLGFDITSEALLTVEDDPGPHWIEYMCDQGCKIRIEVSGEMTMTVRDWALDCPHRDHA